jgi:hypothetical protein
MKTVLSILIAVLTILAIASGLAKITLMQNDVDFFGRYGFSAPMLIAFGAAQLIGGILMPWKKTRFAGATVVAGTFLVSLAILLIDGNVPVTVVTAIATLLLFVVMKMSWPSRSTVSNED